MDRKCRLAYMKKLGAFSHHESGAIMSVSLSQVVHTILEVLERHGNSLCLSDHVAIQTEITQSNENEIIVKIKVRRS